MRALWKWFLLTTMNPLSPFLGDVLLAGALPKRRVRLTTRRPPV
jgi:hypothetical protein